MLLLPGAAILSNEMTSNQFSTLSNSALKVVNGKNYSKVENILEVNNDVVVEHEWPNMYCWLHHFF